MANQTIMFNGGYTKYASLDGEVLSLLDFSITFHKNKIISNGAWWFATSVNKFNRTKGAYIQDVPTVDLSINFEPHKDLIKDIMDKLAKDRTNTFKVKLHDPDSSLKWEFDECYLTSLSVSVSRDSLMNVSMGFFVYLERVKYDWSKRDNFNARNRTDLPLNQKDKKPIAYYRCSVKDGGKEMDDVLSYTFNFSQPITPKYICGGENEDVAPAAKHLLFGLPDMNFSITQLMYKSHDIDYADDNDGTFMQEADKDKFEFEVEGTKIFQVTGCSIGETSLGLGGSFSEYTTNYDVHGLLDD